jgi:hypothetical protein
MTLTSTPSKKASIRQGRNWSKSPALSSDGGMTWDGYLKSAARTFDSVVVRNNFDHLLNFPDDAVKEEEASS